MPGLWSVLEGLIMSVFVHEVPTYGGIAAAILNDRYTTYESFYRSVYTYNDDRYLKSLISDNWERDDAAEDHIHYWMNRLYWANQLAYMLTYGDADRTIRDLPEGYHKVIPMGLKQLYAQLQSIQYNLVSNGGRVMFGKDDMERLENLIASVARRIIRDDD